MKSTTNNTVQETPSVSKTVEISGKRLQVTARAAGIEFEEVFYWKNGRFPKRIVTGIIVAESDKQAILDAIARRNARRQSPFQKEAARRTKQKKEMLALKADILANFPSMPENDAEVCSHHASEIGSGRVGRSKTVESPARAAVVAFIRHNLTDYDSLLDSGIDREEVRRIVAPKLREILEKWEA